MHRVTASIPRTVRVPVAYRLVKKRLCWASLSMLGVMSFSFPNSFIKLALMLSINIKTTLGLASEGSESVISRRIDVPPLIKRLSGSATSFLTASKAFLVSMEV
ncbi:hypothetical protein D3C86_1697050 [compost metagenome]